MPGGGAARLARIVWVLPITLPALGLALLAPLGGGRLRLVAGVVEAAGGLLPGLLRLLHPRLDIAAITLGHVVLARDVPALARTRAHERVHVRQYERWGLFFPVLYLGASLAMRLQGRDAYRDNPFERAARAADPAAGGEPPN